MPAGPCLLINPVLLEITVPMPVPLVSCLANGTRQSPPIRILDHNMVDCFAIAMETCKSHSPTSLIATTVLVLSKSPMNVHNKSHSVRRFYLVMRLCLYLQTLVLAPPSSLLCPTLRTGRLLLPIITSTLQACQWTRVVFGARLQTPTAIGLHTLLELIRMLMEIRLSRLAGTRFISMAQVRSVTVCPVSELELSVMAVIVTDFLAALIPA
jgi:hypothetical protein